MGIHVPLGMMKIMKTVVNTMMTILILQLNVADVAEVPILQNAQPKLNASSVLNLIAKRLITSTVMES